MCYIIRMLYYNNINTQSDFGTDFLAILQSVVRLNSSAQENLHGFLNFAKSLIS